MAATDGTPSRSIFMNASCPIRDQLFASFSRINPQQFVEIGAGKKMIRFRADENSRSRSVSDQFIQNKIQPAQGSVIEQVPWRIGIVEYDPGNALRIHLLPWRIHRMFPSPSSAAPILCKPFPDDNNGKTESLCRSGGGRAGRDAVATADEDGRAGVVFLRLGRPGGPSLPPRNCGGSNAVIAGRDVRQFADIAPYKTSWKCRARP